MKINDDGVIDVRVKYAKDLPIAFKYLDENYIYFKVQPIEHENIDEDRILQVQKALSWKYLNLTQDRDHFSF